MNCTNCGHFISFDGSTPYPKPVIFCDELCLAEYATATYGAMPRAD